MLRPGVPFVIVFVVVFGWEVRCYLLLPASSFQHILRDTGRTNKAYIGHSGHELSLRSLKCRGMILSEFCKKELARQHPKSKFEEPTRGTCCNGARRHATQVEYNFSRDGRKIKCKSAQMSWDNANKVWRLLFHGVKLPCPSVRDQAPFDDLYLIMFSPDSLHIIKHDLETGVRSAGKRTGSIGHQISVQGARGQECWQRARSQILDKFLTKGRNTLVAQKDLSTMKVRSWLTQQMRAMTALHDHEYQGVPLSHMTPTVRGLRIEQIAFEVDQCLHPNCSFVKCSSSGTADWLRGGVRVEIKHGQMLLNKKAQFWRCKFQRIKCAHEGVRDMDSYDELWLAIYSPFGIHFLKHPGGKVHFCDTGVGQQAFGSDIDIYAPKHVLDVREALDEMLRKMKEWGCQPLATIPWCSQFSA